MFNKLPFYLMNELEHKEDLFIISDSKTLQCKPLPIFQPANLDELEMLLTLCQSNGLSHKFIKGENINSFNNKAYNDSLVIDLKDVDKIINLNSTNGTILHQPGLSTKQLINIIEKTNNNFFLPVSCKLIDKLAIVENENSPHTNNKYQLSRKPLHCDNKWISLSFDSIATLYNIFPELINLKEELGNLLISLFIINKKFAIEKYDDFDIYQNFFIDELAFRKKILKSSWHILLEIQLNSTLTPTLFKLIKSRLANNVDCGPSKLNHYSNILRNSIRKKKIRRNQKKTQFNYKKISYHLRIKTSINQLTKHYHQIYLTGQNHCIKPLIIIDLINDNWISLYITVNYKNDRTKQIALKYFMELAKRMEYL